MIVQGTIISSFTTMTLKYIFTKVKGDDDNLSNNKARRKASGHMGVDKFWKVGGLMFWV